MASDEAPISDPVVGIGAILGEEIEVEDVLPPILESDLPSFADRPFDMAIYQPRTHALTLGSILRFEGLLLGIGEDIVLREPAEHLFADASMMRANPLLHRALVERWWDTTDSFHFSSIGELTLTPYDFSLLTGLQVGVGGPIPFDPDMAQWRAAQLYLLGVIPNAIGPRMVRYSWLLEHFSNLQPGTPEEVAQYTYGFLMYLLGTTLFANRENTVGLYLLGALVHLQRVGKYD
ncbi:hypothetical protein ACSBR2_002077 [Camellia fascicularis]